MQPQFVRYTIQLNSAFQGMESKIKATRVKIKNTARMNIVIAYGWGANVALISMICSLGSFMEKKGD